MTLARYEVFRTVVETGGFLKAANELRMTQSAVSHAISSLETEFGFPLLSRGRSGVQLTHNGEKVLSYIHQILNMNELLLQEVAKIKGIKIGKVRIGTFPSVSINWLPKLIKEFRELYPHIEIKLFEGSYEAIKTWILDGVVDFGFLSSPIASSFDFMEIKKDKLLCVLSQHHPLSERKIITLDHLKKESLIVPKTHIDTDVRKILTENNLKSRIKYEMEEDQAIIAMVQHNLGISILPELTLYRLPEGVVVKQLEVEYYRTIGIAATSIDKMAPASKLFVELVKHRIR